jgi:hypothetical protein
VAYLKFPRYSEVQFGETASTAVDINKKLTTFPVLREKEIILITLA